MREGGGEGGREGGRETKMVRREWRRVRERSSVEGERL